MKAKPKTILPESMEWRHCIVCKGWFAIEKMSIKVKCYACKFDADHQNASKVGYERLVLVKLRWNSSN